MKLNRTNSLSLLLMVLSSFLIDAAGCKNTNVPNQTQTSQPTAETSPSTPNQAKGQQIPILVCRGPGMQQGPATLMLAVSWAFVGNGDVQGGRFLPDPELSQFVGPSGIAESSANEPALSFSRIFKDGRYPDHFCFEIGAGDLEIWWSASANSGIEGTPILLSPAWLAASKELPATPEHPSGGISISSQTPDGKPLIFFLDFNPAVNPHVSISGMGTM